MSETGAIAIEAENAGEAYNHTALPAVGILDRETLLAMLSEVLKKQHFKIKSGRLTNLKKEKARQESVRVLMYACSVYGALLKDRDLTEIQKRLEVLEARE